MLGGGDFSAVAQSMYETRLLVFDQKSQKYECTPKADMKVPRHGHSGCSFGSNFIVVSGSRKEYEGSARKCELYDCKKNVWSDLAQMNFGRHYHASCEFNNEFVYVFCGISNQSKKYTTSIERLNVK